ncbi:MAG: hypothetical protein ACE37F_09950 [Nannocystaceae bacterium]|nr:hypothetical protein [bacterium]
MKRRVSLLVALLLGACTSHAEVEVAIEQTADAPHKPKKKAKKTRNKIRAQRPAPALDDRSAYVLAAEITAALREPSLTRGQTLESVRSDWQGKRYRWEVGVSAPLCTGPAACNVLPFDHASQDERIVHGWLPRLSLTEERHAELLERCGAGLCVATVEATLSSFVLSPEDPTSLTFSDVELVEVRARRQGESWVRRKADPRVAARKAARAKG